MTEQTDSLKEPTEAVAEKPAGPFVWATGRRKESVARVRLRAGTGTVQVNGMKMEQYFTVPRMQSRCMAPVKHVGLVGKVDIEVTASGGGNTGQSDAMMMGVARAIMILFPNYEKDLRQGGYMTRDARKVERKKYGRPGARKRFQFSKR